MVWKLLIFWRSSNWKNITLMLTTFLDWYGSMGYLVPKRGPKISMHYGNPCFYFVKSYSPKPSKFEKHIWKLPYESSILGLLLDLKSIFLSPDLNPTTHTTWQTSTASNINPKMKDKIFFKRFAKIRWFQFQKSVLGNLDPYSGTWTYIKH